MREAASNQQPGVDASQREGLDEIADQLYALRPDAFAHARAEQVRKARSEKHPELARAVAALRRPTQSAWLINLLWRDQRVVMEQLLELADGLSRAQSQASAAELRSLTTQRRELESALLRRARTLAEQAGVNVNASTEREAQETLAAALARPEVADGVRTGRLVKPAAYAGFGTAVSVIPPAARPLTDGAEAEPAGLGTDEPRPPTQARPFVKPESLQELAARRARRTAAERELLQARAAAEAAAGALAVDDRAARQAEQHHQELRARVEDLEAQLLTAKDEAAQAERAAIAAARQRAQSQQEREAAHGLLDRAQEALEQ